jgi:hypothetical protein
MTATTVKIRGIQSSFSGPSFGPTYHVIEKGGRWGRNGHTLYSGTDFAKAEKAYRRAGGDDEAEIQQAIDDAERYDRRTR